MINFRKYSLAIAESFDAWRIIPRAVLVGYAALVLNLYLWFKSIPTYIQEKCDAAVLKIFLDSGMDIEHAMEVACSIVDVVGGPTTAQSAFVTTIVGLSAGIFGLYTATGRKWERGMPSDLNDNGVDDSDELPDEPVITPGRGRNRRRTEDDII